MKWLNIDQGSIEWKNIRLGLFTSSDIFNLFVKAKDKKNISKTAETYIKQKAIECIYPPFFNDINSNALQHGLDYESDAIQCYEMIKNKTVSNGGFFIFDNYSGSSPDGLIGNDGLIEVKCPFNRVNHLNNVLSLKDDIDLYKLSKKYYYQVHHQLFCTGRKWIDFCSFDPRLLNYNNFLHVIRIERNQELMDEMAEVIYNAGKEKDKIIELFNK